MSEIKSAFEIALEKSSKLGSASAEEQEAMAQKEFAPVGRNLAERYLRGEYQLRDIAIALEKQERGRDVVLAAVRFRLAEALAHGDCQVPLEGLKFLAQNKASVEAAARRADTLCRQRQETKRQRMEVAARTIEQAKRQELESLGTSGSAIRIEVSATIEGQRIAEEIDAGFSRDMDELRPDLMA